MNNEILKLFIKKAIGLENDSIANFVLKQASIETLNKNMEGFYVEWDIHNKHGCLKIANGELIVKHDRYN